MNRLLIGAFLLTAMLPALAQKDTVVVTDFTNVLVETNPDGMLSPVTSLGDVTQAGFFLGGHKAGYLRFCNPQPLSIWINGRLLAITTGCEFFDLAEVLSQYDANKVFVSLSSGSKLDELTCDLVVFEELKIVRDEVSLPRASRNVFQEFIIAGWILIVLFLGSLLVRYPSRISYIRDKTFTFKTSAYEFVNTNFFSGPSLNLIVLYALCISFSLLYFNYGLNLNFFESMDSLQMLLWQWIRTAIIIFALFVLKWIIISVIGGLFSFKNLNNYQLFDFLNFQIILIFPMLIFLFLDFILNERIGAWLTSGAIILFPLSLILFIIWFTLKFVNNSPRKKLMIISYLCATEIIPVVFLLGVFYK